MPHSEFLNQLIALGTPTNLLVLVGTVVLGIIFGAMPGLTATLGVALLTTATFSLKLPMDTSMVALLGVYVGAIYGGSHTAILLNIPGTAASAATAVEGYPLNKQGRGGEAIGTATITSFIGTVLGVLAMLALIPLLSQLAQRFTAVEFFLLAVFGVMICGSLTSPDTPVKGWIAGFLGLLMAMVGRDAIQGYPRFTFGLVELMDGIEPIPVLLGGFALPQVLRNLKDPAVRLTAARVTRILPRWSDIYRNWMTIIRSGLVGVGVGAIPGVGEDVAAWMSYDLAKKFSRRRDLFGKGSMEGVVASETANNACIGGALIPLLTLGVPGSPPAAMLLGAILLANIVPGPRLPVESPHFIPMMSAILLWASAAMLVCGLAMSKVSVHVVRMPLAVLMPLVALFTIMGAYALEYSMFHVAATLAFGLIAYLMEEMGYPIAPLVIGIILGPMADENLRRALLASQGKLTTFFYRVGDPVHSGPRYIALFLVGLIVLSVVNQTPIPGMIRRLLGRRKPEQAPPA